MTQGWANDDNFISCVNFPFKAEVCCCCFFGGGLSVTVIIGLWDESLAAILLLSALSLAAPWHFYRTHLSILSPKVEIHFYVGLRI